MWKHHFICFQAIAEQQSTTIYSINSNPKQISKVGVGGGRGIRGGSIAPYPPPLATALPSGRITVRNDYQAECLPRNQSEKSVIL